MRTHRSWSATAWVDCRGQRPLGGSYPVLGPPPCPAQADPAGPAVHTDPLVVTMKPGDTYILEGERVLTATIPQVHKASGPCGAGSGEPASPPARSAPSDPAPCRARLEPQAWPLVEHATPTGGTPGWGARPSWGGPLWTDGTLPPRSRPLEDLQELLQDTLSPGRALQASRWLSGTG